MTRSRLALRGFTFFETMLTISIFSLIALWFSRISSTTAGLAADSLVATRAEEEHRRNLRALADAVRGASYGSLSGFDATGASTSPSFATVKAYSTGGAVLDTPVQWLWKATPAAVKGIQSPGEIVSVQGTATKRMATHVPLGGFKAMLNGNTLKIQLTTYYASSKGATVTISGEAAVSLRN